MKKSTVLVSVLLAQTIAFAGKKVPVPSIDADIMCDCEGINTDGITVFSETGVAARVEGSNRLTAIVNSGREMEEKCSTQLQIAEKDIMLSNCELVD